MQTFLNVVQIIVAVALTVAILFQVKGGGLGGIFGNPGSAGFRTRRGVEKTLFQFTIALVVIFLVIAVLSVRIS